MLRSQTMTGYDGQEIDREWVRRMAAGDEPALRALAAAYGQRLYAYAVRLTGDPATSEEVVQDSLVAAWQGARRFRGQGRVIAWLLGIVHHKALNAMRGRRVPLVPLPATEDGVDLPAESAAQNSPADQVTLGDRRHRLRAALDRLSPPHRMVLELIFYQGLSLQEAAAVCGCPVGTVKSRLSYAKASLREVLGREGLSAEDLLG